jgi:hypothetical protein
MSKQYIDAEDVKQTLENMHKDAADNGSKLFELIHEDKVRGRLISEVAI